MLRAPEVSHILSKQATTRPCQTFWIEPEISPRVLQYTRIGETAAGLLFIGPDEPGASFVTPMITTDSSELVSGMPRQAI